MFPLQPIKKITPIPKIKEVNKSPSIIATKTIRELGDMPEPIKDTIDKKKKELDLTKTEKLKNNQPVKKNGGARPGAGRPQGRVSEETLKKQAAQKYIEDTVIKSISGLLNSQMNIARGARFLFKITTKKVKKNGKWVNVRSKPKIVEDELEIAEYLAGDKGNGDTEYYFMTTQKPDNKALDSLLNRVFGKPKETLDLNGNLTIEDLMMENIRKRREAQEEDE